MVRKYGGVKAVVALMESFPDSQDILISGSKILSLISTPEDQASALAMLNDSNTSMLEKENAVALIRYDYYMFLFV